MGLDTPRSWSVATPDPPANGSRTRSWRASARRAATPILAGIEPTPAIAYLTVDMGAASGVVISASHNPPEYNGIKFFASNGMKLPDAIEDEIEESLSSPGEHRPGPRGDASRPATPDIAIWSI